MHVTTTIKCAFTGLEPVKVALSEEGDHVELEQTEGNLISIPVAEFPDFLQALEVWSKHETVFNPYGAGAQAAERETE